MNKQLTNSVYRDSKGNLSTEKKDGSTIAYYPGAVVSEEIYDAIFQKKTSKPKPSEVTDSK
jgi:hypothetical protein